MKYVVDSSIAVKWALVEQGTDKARRLRDDFRQTVHELLAPDVFSVEAAHALTRAERQGRIKLSESIQLLADILITAPALHSYHPLLARAAVISSAMRVGVYDCLYVALAEQETCEFVTADDKLVKNLQSTFPFIIPLSSLP